MTFGDEYKKSLEVMVNAQWKSTGSQARCERILPLTGAKNLGKFRAQIIQKAGKMRDQWEELFIRDCGRNSTMEKEYLPYYKNLMEDKIQNIDHDEEVNVAWNDPLT